MTRMLISALAVTGIAAPAFAGLTTGVINEFHYDNQGGDVGEFIEIVIDSSLLAGDFDVVLYNGSNGGQYNSYNLANDFVDHGVLGDGFQYFSISLPTNGLQNGSPDGIGLAYQGAPLEFLSYEGAFSANGGIFDGENSTDINALETSGTPIGSSLQRIGFGDNWGLTEGFNSQGAINNIPAPSALALLGLAGIAGRRRRG